MFGIPLQFEEILVGSDLHIVATDLHNVVMLEDWATIKAGESFSVVVFILLPTGMEIHFWKQEEEDHPLAFSVNGQISQIPYGMEYEGEE